MGSSKNDFAERVEQIRASIPLELHTFGTGEIELSWAEGPDNGRPLIMLPGMGSNWQTYIFVAEELARHFHLYLVDLRGHGSSSRAEDAAYQVSDYGRDLAALIEQRVCEPAIVSGHSLGGLVAAWLGANHSDIISGLVFEDAPFFVSEHPVCDTHWMRPFFVSWRKRLHAFRDGNGDIGAAKSVLLESGIGFPRVDVPYERRIMALGKLLSISEAAGMPPIAEADRGRIYAGYEAYLAGTEPQNKNFWPDFILDAILYESISIDPEILTHIVEGTLNSGFDHREAFRKIRAPTLYWQADRDVVGHVTDEDIQSICSLLSDATAFRHVYMPLCGHYIHRDAPHKFADEIRSFFVT